MELKESMTRKDFNTEEPEQDKTTNLGEAPSLAVLKKLIKEDKDFPSLGLMQWLFIAAIVIKKVFFICLALAALIWTYYQYNQYTSIN